SLFAAGCHSGAILNGCSDQIVCALKAYGLNLGICFQVVDDLLDVTQTSIELGKACGADLAQGVITAPALFVLERDDKPARQLEKLIKARAVCQPEGLAEALEIIRNNGGLDATIELAKKYANASRDALRALPPSNCRDSLALMVDYLLLRTN
ncbi:MAG: polyprenyl synthetase family protein, partial [Candidatus Melainabacteria bacterium]|nr:polyprenyl synthetase family protein [Candidatus Melainabacteria bacterium]